MKLAGATYMDIHKAGGGIGFTVGHTRNSSEQELETLLLPRLQRMLQCGTTLVEGKSGYGLDCETEMKLLRVLHNARSKSKIEIVSTYLGAHSIPKGKNVTEYTHEVINEHIPILKELISNGISVENIDVFCEKGVFEIDDTRKILQAGKNIGLEINFHGDELNPMKAAELGGELSALAISHLEHISDEGIQSMLIRPTFAVLLPTTAYILRLTPPPARKMIEAGVPVVIATDYNPNAHCLSMPFVMNLACVLMRMSLNEALVASTLNAAGSLKKSDKYGSLSKSKFGDFVVIAAPKWEHIVYQLVDPPILHVYKKGIRVYTNPNIIF
eukprot:TRINITY_DN4724_c0_g1_i2.p1 TRINITY_DN4724_c0_g1~~TRINITY_DN4724_c0_g1_i2.p1  ORF type:complete len:328 (+),score=148.28 TRINITY_DN4724_c0_g1_i2:367-1350(+)